MPVPGVEAPELSRGESLGGEREGEWRGGDEIFLFFGGGGLKVMGREGGVSVFLLCCVCDGVSRSFGDVM